uniref:Uncharacterized protein TCIL3000_6_1980 n=1 Tax=Trypanosoma congolense (strain IL3000) TaxID=1068625 RepID=G0UNK3_TRYCI|nr:unnamed protein product [Trypanosoma congolense IL3000]
MRRLPFANAFSAASWKPSQLLLQLPHGALLSAMCFASLPGMPVRNLYKRLGIGHMATTEEIKAAYRQRALECHPDVVDESQKAQAEVRFRSVSEAYDILMDPHRRKEHDKALGFRSTVAEAKETQKEKGTVADPEVRSAGTTAASQRRKPFVRGDADRMFREVFHGMTLDQVIFKERLRQRQARRHSQGNKKNDGDEFDKTPCGREESIRRVTIAAAERFAAKVQRQYGPDMLRHVRVYSGSRAPQPPPSDYMPFRPFHGWAVPEGVRTPPEPTLGPTSRVEDEENVQLAVSSISDGTRRRELPKHFPAAQACGSPASLLGHALDRMERERNSPHNMGKLYSYRRPY